MNIAYFDCPFGAAGDMLLGALLASASIEDEWRHKMETLVLPTTSFDIDIQWVQRCGIRSKQISVNFEEQKVHRGFADIEKIILKSSLNHEAKKLALRIFKTLADAEARVHGVQASEVHFHEVGAIDAIVDIAGFALAYGLLDIELSYASPLPLGAGTVNTEHGTYPVPAPAVVKILEKAKAPISKESFPFECLTPTGAAILATVVSHWGQIPPMSTIDRAGYGAGTRDPKGWPNVSRVLIGQASEAKEESSYQTESVYVIEANLDDLQPQTLAYTQEQLLKEGALDVTVTPAVMKKGRAGHILSAIARPEDKLRLQELILKETSSLGVRAYLTERLVCRREWHQVALSPGESVRVKVAKDLAGRVTNIQPEFEDLKRYAERNKRPLKEVYSEVVSRADFS